jgi:hypothetical protein
LRSEISGPASQFSPDKPVLGPSVNVSRHVAEIETQILRRLGKVPRLFLFKRFGAKLARSASDLIAVQKMYADARNNKGDKQTAQ